MHFRFNGGHLKFRCYFQFGLRYTLFHIYFRLMAAIFDTRHTQTSESIPTSLSVLLKLKKRGYGRWNFVSIMYRSLDIPFTNVDTCISDLTAAILNF